MHQNIFFSRREGHGIKICDEQENQKKKKVKWNQVLLI